MAPIGSGTPFNCISPMPSRSGISTMRASTCGNSRPNFIQRFSPPEALDDEQAGQTGQRQNRNLVASLRPLASSHPGLAKLIRTEADYFQTNAERMRYPKFRRQKL